MQTKRILLVLAVCLIAAVPFLLATDPKIEAGMTAPEFTLPSQDGSQISLSQFKGHWVVLYFYPKDFTSGCTIEAHKFQEAQDKFKAIDAVVLGVSVDTADSHQQFCTKEGLTFKLLSDSDAQVSTKYDSIMEYQGHKLAARHTFVIDPSGKVVKTYNEVNPNKHTDEVLADLQGLQKK